MTAKLAALVVEKKDGSVETVAGEKGEIVAMAKEMIRAANDDPANDVYRITAFGSVGILKDRRWKSNAAEVVAAPAEEIEEIGATELREALKAKGVRVPPRISIESMRKLATENGIEV